MECVKDSARVWDLFSREASRSAEPRRLLHGESHLCAIGRGVMCGFVCCNVLCVAWQA